MMTENTKKFLAKLEGLHQALFYDLLDLGYRYSLSPQVYASLRTPEEQNALFQKGRDERGEIVDKSQIVTNAKAWQSMHNYGCAIDIYFLENGKALWNRQLFACLWALAKEHGLHHKGLRWGGDFFGFDDPNHFEISHGLSYREMARKKDLGPYA